MSSELSTTSYALLGLLAFDSETSTTGMTGYELKQRADKTLRFYWVSPATSQIYTELSKLDRHGLVEAMASTSGRRTTRRFIITTRGEQALETWLQTSPVEFPALKHPVALRLLMGHRLKPDQLETLLANYHEALEERSAELQLVREALEGNPETRFPAMVADWGLHYYASENEVVERLRSRLEE